MFKYIRVRNYRFTLVLWLCLLTVIGILVIGSAKASVQNKQLLGFFAGLLFMIIISLIDYSWILKFSWVYYVLTIGLLLLVKFAGKTTGGSQRWISIAGIQFQPSELAKILLILFFASFFMKYQEKLNTFKTLALSFLLVGIPLVLILSQPDTSTTIVTAFVFVALLFIAGLSYKIIAVVLMVTIPASIVAIIYVLRNAETLVSEHYQFKRIMSWLDPTNPLYSDAATQQQNSIMAIGSGQLFGKGLNNSVATSMNNTNYIIEPQTDFIFAVAGEELGFLGCMAIIILLLLIVIECVMIGRRAKDLAGRLICCGMASLIAFQAFVNISVTTGLMPNTGIPLPFVSYGLTSLMSLYVGMGFVLNVGLQPKKYNKGGFV